MNPLAAINERMRGDWDARAREDAGYYVAFGRRRQTPEEFFASADDVLRCLRDEFRRYPPDQDLRELTALEIGCGPGRLMLPLSRIFGRITGVDVSSEMTSLARENLAGVPNAEVRVSSGADLAGIPDNSIDFCYSYAVFQHIPDKEVVWNYLREACRVLRPGGLLKFQFNGLLSGEPPELPPEPGWSLRACALPGEPVVRDGSPETWWGVSFRPEELAAFAARHGLALLAMDGFDTQYLWLTARKPLAASAQPDSELPPVRILGIANTFTEDAVVAQSGRFASASLSVDALPEPAGLNNLRVEIDGRAAAPNFIGKAKWTDPVQINVYLPPEVRSGVLPVRLTLAGEPLSDFARLRVIPRGAQVPKIVSVTDGVNLLSAFSIESRLIKVQIEDLPLAGCSSVRDAFEARIGGMAARAAAVFCVDPMAGRYEINVAVPEEAGGGRHELSIRIGQRLFPSLFIEIPE